MLQLENNCNASFLEPFGLPKSFLGLHNLLSLLDSWLRRKRVFTEQSKTNFTKADYRKAAINSSVDKIICQDEVKEEAADISTPVEVLLSPLVDDDCRLV